ncbi:hypothetical protein BOX15_Mlig026989g2, partial [Macrostomum lignano]
RGTLGIGPPSRLVAAPPTPSADYYRHRRIRRRRRRRLFRRRLANRLSGFGCLIASALLSAFGGHLARLIVDAVHRRHARPSDLSAVLSNFTMSTDGPEPSTLANSDRPFLVVYTSACLMSLQLIGFSFLPDWWQQRRFLYSSRRRPERQRQRPAVVDASDVQIGEGVTDYDNLATVEEAAEKADEAKMSDPHFVPVQFDSSSTEAELYSSLNAEYASPAPSAPGAFAAADEASPLLPQSQPLPEARRARGVRFSRISEVRQLSESEAHAASMARMSYQAYQRALESSLEVTDELDEFDEDELDYDDFEHDFDDENVEFNADAEVTPASEAAEATPTDPASAAAGTLSLVETVKLALMFAPLWFVSTWCLLESQRQALSTQTAVAFVSAAVAPVAALLLAGLFPSVAPDTSGRRGGRRTGSAEPDAATLSKAACVLACVAGALLIAWPQLLAWRHLFVGASTGSGLWGSVLAALGALCVALSLVGLRRRAPRLRSLPSLAMFFGFIGAVSCMTMWPGFFILHYSRLEQFQLPNATNWGRFVFHGLTGVALSEFLLVLGCYLTNSLAACMSCTLAVPLACVAGIAFFHRPASEIWRLSVGGPLTVLAFVAALWLPRVGDPLLSAVIAFRDLTAGPAGVLTASSTAINDSGDSDSSFEADNNAIGYDEDSDGERLSRRQQRRSRRIVRHSASAAAASSVAGPSTSAGGSLL